MSSLESALNRKKIGDKKFNQLNDQTVSKKIVRENTYKTNGEILIVVKDTELCNLTLDSLTTEHIIVKALTKVIIKPSQNLIDEFYDEIEIDKGACVEFYLLENNWYIVSSDGLKLE
jgi:hypothetical protein